MSKNGNKAEKPVRAERKATFAGALIAFLLCVAVIMAASLASASTPRPLSSAPSS